jgi:D-3-phosphoglycerate dehydrogenase / 2-oxoglutarate reductase
MGKILVTPRSLTKDGDPALELLKAAGHEVVFCTPGRQPDEEEMLRLVPGCLGWLAGVEKITPRVLEAARGLKAISRNGTGIDNVDLEAAKRLGIAVLRAEGANARGVAELSFALLLALARSIPFGDAALKTGKWERRQGIELEGRTLGLVGCGKIGKMVARFALAMDMTVLAFDAYPDASFAPAPGFRFAKLEDVLAASHAVSLHCPHKPGEPPLIDAAAIAKMRKGALLVNTARAGLVDAAAVRKALDEGKLAGYGVDVFDKEPPEPGPLTGHDRVVMSAHVGGYTAESVARTTRVAVENLLSALK